MKKTLPVLFALLLITSFFAYDSHAQMPQKGSKNTMTLPNGDVIWDLNGEWDTFTEHLGAWSHLGSYPGMMKITQTGSSLVGIRMVDTPNALKGSEALRGELDKSGFNKVQLIAPFGPLPSSGQISEDGNKIKIESGPNLRTTCTRK
jgi:hypothetical protein